MGPVVQRRTFCELGLEAAVLPIGKPISRGRQCQRHDRFRRPGAAARAGPRSPQGTASASGPVRAPPGPPEYPLVPGSLAIGPAPLSGATYCWALPLLLLLPERTRQRYPIAAIRKQSHQLWPGWCRLSRNVSTGERKMFSSEVRRINAALYPGLRATAPAQAGLVPDRTRPAAYDRVVGDNAKAEDRGDWYGARHPSRTTRSGAPYGDALGPLGASR